MNNKELIKIFVLAALLISGFSVTGAAAPSLSNAGGGSWSNYREITITNSGSALTDYQVFVQLSGSSFPTTTSNGADIRFIDSNGNELSYWIENWDYAGKSGSIWVKVPNVPPSGYTIIKMYYGNPSAASMSDGEGTFAFFDDFDTNTLGNYDTNLETVNYSNPAYPGWKAPINPKYDSTNKRVNINNGDNIETTLSPKNLNLLDAYAEAVFHIDGAYPAGGGGVINIRWQDADNEYQGGKEGSEYSTTGWGGNACTYISPYIYKVTAGKETILSSPTGNSYINMGNEQKVGFGIAGNTLKLFIDDELVLQTTDNSITSQGRIVFTGRQYNGWIDNIRVRKYTSPEPTMTLGAEQSVPTQPITGNISVSSSPTGAEVLVDGASKGPAPVTVPNVSPGSHDVKCELSEYVDYDTSAIVTAGSTYSVICSLVKEGELSVTLSSEPTSIKPGQISSIKITVTKDGAPISGVSVMLSSTPNVKFSSSSGTTAINGEFISTFTPSTEGEIKVSALAKKEGINDGKGETIVQVGKITPTPTTVPGQATITGKVMDAGTDDPLQDVTITVDGKSVTTGSNGEYELSVDVGKHTLSASKSGYETMTRSIIVPEVGNVFDLSLKPATMDDTIVWSWIVKILILIVAAAGIIYIFNRKKKQKAEQKTDRIKVEGPKVETKKVCIFCKAPLPVDSKFCKECGKKQEEKTRFCMHCGAPMPHAPDSCIKCGKLPPSHTDVKTCKNCGEVIPVPAKFCSACGAGQPE